MGIQGPNRGLVKNDSLAMTQRADVPRSRFITRHTVNTTFDAGFLVPFVCDEILPGDHMEYDVAAFLRMATPLFPLFDSQQVATFFFFVPNRLVWNQWAEFMGEADPNDLVNEWFIPQVQSEPGGFAKQGLFDHFGLPVQQQLVAPNRVTVNALPARAYSLIWNDWFRDQNIQSKVTFDKNETQQPEAVFQLLRRNKFHDYFTSCLPFPQKSLTPTIPLTGQVPVRGIGFAGSTAQTGPSATLRETGGNNTAYTFFSVESFQPLYVRFGASSGAASYPQIFADLALAGGMSVNDLRRAMQLQELYEKDARGGTRYVENIFAHFGVRNPDYRLQRPEYIGGGSSPMTVTPVAQTAVGGGTTVGALGAASTGSAMHRASYAATEHGYIIGLINIQSDLSYQQGVHRMWTRSTRLDFYWPSFAHLGEQAVLRQEIYYKNDGNDLTVFGYQERYGEYKHQYSTVSGKFRSEVTGSLDAWHLSQRFNSAPVLNTAFIIDNPPMSRVLAAGTQAETQQYLANILVSRSATRPIPTYGTPQSLGRF